MFLDDDTETATVSKSGWTGLGEFLSNEAISQKMHKSMRIQEWELRLVMEYCNKGAALSQTGVTCKSSAWCLSGASGFAREQLRVGSGVTGRDIPDGRPLCAGNLKEAIRQKSLMADGSVKALEVALLALDIAKACQAIHKHNIIHGDLKPHNVLLTVVCLGPELPTPPFCRLAQHSQPALPDSGRLKPAPARAGSCVSVMCFCILLSIF